MKVIPYVLFLLITQSCIASNNCSDPETQYDMNICSGIKLSAIEGELESKVKNISDHLEKIDSSKLFVSSNEAWIKFRNLHCESVSKIYESGSIHTFIESECKIMLTQERISNLENDYKDIITTILESIPNANK